MVATKSQKAYAEHFETRKTDGTVIVQNGAIRFLAADTVFQKGTFLVKRSNPSENTDSYLSILYVREKGDWQFAQLCEVPSEASLRELEGLVGTWAFESDGGLGTVFWVRTTKGWLARSVVADADGAQLRSGTTLTSADADTIEGQ